MRRWLRQWYGKRNVRPELGHEDMALIDELEDATSAEFEIRFFAHMSVHHAQAIERAKVGLKRAKDPWVRKCRVRSSRPSRARSTSSAPG